MFAICNQKKYAIALANLHTQCASKSTNVTNVSRSRKSKNGAVAHMLFLHQRKSRILIRQQILIALLLFHRSESAICHKGYNDVLVTTDDHFYYSS